MKKDFRNNIYELNDNEVFIFGSNIEGRHGAGAALSAKRFFGAKSGIGEGLVGKSYGFPTVKKMSPYTPIKPQNYFDFLKNLKECIEKNTDKIFYLTELGCGLAGGDSKFIAPIFQELEQYNNVIFPLGWKKYLNKMEENKFW